MCNLRYVDKIVDKAIVCHLIPNSSCGVLMQHLLKQQKKHPKIRATLIIKEMHNKIK